MKIQYISAKPAFYITYFFGILRLYIESIMNGNERENIQNFSETTKIFIC